MWRVFWPAAMIWVTILLVSEYFFALPHNALTFFWPTLGFLYQSFVMASGLIRWHRYLIRDEAPSSPRFWLLSEEWRFWWRWFWLGIMVVLVGVLSSIAIMMLLSIIIYSVGGNPAEFATAKLIDKSWHFSIVIFVIGMAFCGWLFPRTFLSLAAIAVREGDSYRRTAKQQISRFDCFLLGFAILVVTAPLMIVTLTPVMSQAPINADGSYDITFLYVVISLISNVLNFFAIIVFATMLSLFYRSRIEAAPDQAASAP